MDDDFFDAGGDSLAAMRVVARVRDDFGVAVSVRQLFEHPSLDALSAVVQAALDATPSAIPEHDLVPVLDRSAYEVDIDAF